MSQENSGHLEPLLQDAEVDSGADDAEEEDYAFLADPTNCTHIPTMHEEELYAENTKGNPAKVYMNYLEGFSRKNLVKKFVPI